MSAAAIAFDFDLLISEKNEELPPTSSALDDETSIAVTGHDGGYRIARLAEGLDFVFLTRAAVADGEAPGGVRLFQDGVDGLAVEECSQGSVPTLVARNQGAHDFLLIAGQLLSGGRQNRGLNTDLLIAAGQSAEIPVTCVEQGRWSPQPRGRFHHAGIEPLEVRTGKHRDVSSSMRSGSGHQARQDEVWRRVSEISRDLGAANERNDLLESMSQARARRGGDGAHAATDPGLRQAIVERIHEHKRLLVDLARAMADVAAAGDDAHIAERLVVLQRHQSAASRRLREQLEALRMLDAQPPVESRPAPACVSEADALARRSTGLLVYFDGEFVAGDLFSSTAWFGAIYPDLRESALTSWERVARRRTPSADGHADILVESVARHARAVVRDAAQGAWHEKPTPAHGRQLLLEHPSLEGSVLCKDRAPLHLLLGTRQTPRVFRSIERRGRGRDDLPRRPR